MHLVLGVRRERGRAERREQREGVGEEAIAHPGITRDVAQLRRPRGLTIQLSEVFSMLSRCSPPRGISYLL